MAASFLYLVSAAAVMFVNTQVVLVLLAIIIIIIFYSALKTIFKIQCSQRQYWKGKIIKEIRVAGIHLIIGLIGVHAPVLQSGH